MKTVWCFILVIFGRRMPFHLVFLEDCMFQTLLPLLFVSVGKRFVLLMLQENEALSLKGVFLVFQDEVMAEVR